MATGTSEAEEERLWRTSGAAATRELGRRLGRALRPGDCLALKGELGSGKTVLAQGIVSGAGGGEDVRSPTFLLHAVYPGRVTVHHLDLYRLEAEVDLRRLGIDEALEEGAVVVEWPERCASAWFNGEVGLEILDSEVRQISLRLRSGLLDGD
ncbi:MAG: tRNA (adenosine(37)-N6)-threonylcarbamoyltransferase complex ATPase subunit type 1 TsaE [Candidatus Dormibacteria bacterium]